LSNNQLDEALKQYKQLAEADPETRGAGSHLRDSTPPIKYEDALATIRKARKLDPTNLEAGYNEGCCSMSSAL